MAEVAEPCQAVFLDRDGVLNDVVYRDGEPCSPRTEAEVRVPAGVPDAVERLRREGFRVFVVTNQPEIARGLITRERAQVIGEHIRTRVGVDEYRVCPHDDADGCDCRKPKPGMIHDLAARWNVDLAASYMIGDRWKDVEAGRVAGCRTILLRRPYNDGARADHEAESLPEAAELILANDRA